MSEPGEGGPPPGDEATEGSAPEGEGPRTTDYGLRPESGPREDVLVPGELPVANIDEALRDAVGARSELGPQSVVRGPQSSSTDVEYDAGDDIAGSDARRRKTIIVSSVAIVVGLTIAAFVFLGRANAQRYLLVCAADHVSAEQGRGFPPWGSRQLGGPEWKTIPLPPNATCKAGETHEVEQLAGWYLAILIDRANATLKARDLLDHATTGKTSDLDIAAAQLDQALLLSRDPDWDKERKQVEHLLGDVEYWRASLKLRDAAAALTDAAKQFDAATARKPAHAEDSAAWGDLVRRVAGELHAGPADATLQPAVPVGEPRDPHEPHVPAPPGVALPVEPPPSGSATEPSAPAPDAGVPTGGVLL